MTSNRGPSILEKFTKLLESISKRSTQTDINDRNDILENVKSQQTIHSLRLMAIVYESLMACRNDNSGILASTVNNDKDCAVKSVNLSQRINEIYKDYGQVVGFGNRITRLANGEETNKMHSIFKGWSELMGFTKKVNKPESIFFTSYNQLADFSKKILGYKKDEIKNDKANVDASNQANSLFGKVKGIVYTVNMNNIYWAFNSVYEPTAAWMTKEQAFKVWDKGSEAQQYITQNAVYLFHNAKSLDREGYKKLLYDLCTLVGNAMPSDLPKLLSVSCVVNTLRALAEFHLEETGEPMPTIPGILLDSISILLQMVGFRSTESDKVIIWLKKLAYTQAVETLIAILFVQLLSIVKDVYAKDGKTLDNVFVELCWKLGMIESTDMSITDKMYKWWGP